VKLDGTPSKPRLLIVCDGDRWYVRRLVTITHDLASDEKIYRCDAPIGGACKTIAEAVRVAKAAARAGRATVLRKRAKRARGKR
jgi:hypothetical protein